MDTEDLVEKTADVREKVPLGCYIRARYVFTFMGFLGMFNLYSLRSNLSVAVVAMVNLTNEETGIKSNVTIACPTQNGWDNVKSGQHGPFNWNMAQQGLLLGCYYYGYIFTCLPGGYLAGRFGARVVLGTTMLISSIITILFPLLAYVNFSLVVAARILLGLLQGVTSPCVFTACANWAPLQERSLLISVALSGSSFGTFVTLPLAGIIAENIGWEAVFYFTGGFALVWSIVWFGIIHNTPQEHPRISEEERTYIVHSIGLDKSDRRGTKYRTPWKEIVTSSCVWAVVAAQFAGSWGNYTLMAMLPTYLATILRFNLSASGELSALPYLLQFLLSVGGGYLTDVIISRHFMSIIGIRKLNTALALAVPAISIVLAGYIGCDLTAAVTLLSISAAFIGLNTPGCLANLVDIAPKFAGIVYAMSNTIGNIPGFLTPQIAGQILLHEDTISRWQAVFWLSAAVNSTGAMIYLVLGSDKEQPWSHEISIYRESDEA